MSVWRTLATMPDGCVRHFNALCAVHGHRHVDLHEQVDPLTYVQQYVASVRDPVTRSLLKVVTLNAAHPHQSPDVEDYDGSG